MPRSIPHSFDDVFKSELEEIAVRRAVIDGESRPSATEGPATSEGKDDVAVKRSLPDPRSLAGLALSGGGIRSATTSLGVLQALRKMGILNAFDYLSTVSGGGFTGGWWSAWTSREFDAATPTEARAFPPEERTQPQRDAMAASAVRAAAAGAPVTDDAPTTAEELRQRQASVDPVHHLRLFSNYLTPSTGLMSSDTWRAITVVSRNLVLTWLVLIPILFAAVLLAQAYFVTQPDSETEFLYPYSHQKEDRDLNLKLSAQAATIGHLDGIVHHTKSAGSVLDAAFGKQTDDGKPASPDAILMAVNKDVDTLLKDELVDSAIAADAGKHSAYVSLHRQLESMGALAGKVESLAANVGPPYAPDNPLAILVETSPMNTMGAVQRQMLSSEEKVDATLDKVVDSARVNLKILQDGMIRERWEERDKLLFDAKHRQYLAERLFYASYIPIGILACIIMFIVLWMLNLSNASVGRSILQGTFAFLAGSVAFGGMLFGFPSLIGVEPLKSPFLLVGATLLWQIIALILLHRVIWDNAHAYWKSTRNKATAETRYELMRLLEVRRARIVTSHQNLMLTLFLTVIFMAFGGFGHELINYLLWYESSSHGHFQQLTARLASVVGILGALSGSSLIARNTIPARAGHAEKKQGKLVSLLMAAAPPLVLVILLCGISWLGHWVLQHIAFSSDLTGNPQYLVITISTFVFGGASLYYAAEELHLMQGRRLLRDLLFILCIICSVGIWVYLRSQPFTSTFAWAGVGMNLLAWIVIFRRTRRDRGAAPIVTNDPQVDLDDLEMQNVSIKSKSGKRGVVIKLVASLAIVIATQCIIIFSAATLEHVQMPFHWPYFAGLIACVIMLIYEFIWGSDGNHESRILIGAVGLMLTTFLFIPTVMESEHWGVLHVLATLVSAALGLVIFIGWRVDPNALSIHAFYRSRIVRAYLGASNWLRGRSGVTDVHANDDVPLVSLRNTSTGAPYHIVNTTLNLLGAKSLEAAQRHASNFIMTKRYCGSSTTGYRQTAEYMSGELTLGTAVAISGAAASPNMGAVEVSGAVTILMSLMNIRLGYWAANPTQKRWREPQPRLWPYYILKETLSQTTGLGSYCYLTDGGHFDNTAIYPLVERACRYIVVCDNGADPNSHFNDIGNAFRRCRIDFGAEFALEGLREMTDLDEDRGLASAAVAQSGEKRHWLRGTVTYSEEHLRSIWGSDWDSGLSETEKLDQRTGTILILKPVILGDEPADVLQYSLENPDFPQQSTADQWFTENQFESYRRLGNWTAASAFGFADLTGSDRATKLRAIEAMLPGSHPNAS